MSEGAILLHGIGRTAASMRPLAAALERAGYATLAVDDPSRARDLAASPTGCRPGPTAGGGRRRGCIS